MSPWNQPSNRYPPLDGSGLGRLAWPPSGMVCWSTLPPPAVSKLTVQAAVDRAWAVAASPEVPRVGDAGVRVVWLRGENVASGDDDGAAVSVLPAASGCRLSGRGASGSCFPAYSRVAGVAAPDGLLDPPARAGAQDRARRMARAAAAKLGR